MSTPTSPGRSGSLGRSSASVTERSAPGGSAAEPAPGTKAGDTAATPSAAAPWARLTRYVLRCMLGITVGTVQTYVKRVYRKLEVHSKAEAANVALRNGLV